MSDDNDIWDDDDEIESYPTGQIDALVKAHNQLYNENRRIRENVKRFNKEFQKKHLFDSIMQMLLDIILMAAFFFSNSDLWIIFSLAFFFDFFLYLKGRDFKLSIQGDDLHAAGG